MQNLILTRLTQFEIQQIQTQKAHVPISISPVSFWDGFN